ncbi:glycosyltransferase family 25 protein [Bradyrhizobium sp. SZCCHNR2020]|uniref:glycosyltransferase family 25 protein n=1 Tax=unclassified Bradyrhizobium TaxID=2631580 RepID=UPI0039674D50
MVKGAVFRCFDRIAIIHLPEREDRLRELTTELEFVGLDIKDRRVEIPQAPRPSSPEGFPSRGVYGNFLSHLGIIRQAYEDGLRSVLVLEDDAIFSHEFSRRQSELASALSSDAWDVLFLGHSVSRGLPFSKSGLVRYSGDFLWAHCYAVNRRIMPHLAEYLEETIDRPVGHPLGGKMYIDAAHTLFRRLNPDAVCLLSSPCMLSWSRRSGQDDKWNFCLTTAIIAANRRDHEETTPPEPLTGLQGEGGPGCHQGRSDDRPTGRAFRRSPQSDHSVEIATRGQRV